MVVVVVVLLAEGPASGSTPSDKETVWRRSVRKISERWGGFWLVADVAGR